MAIKLKVIPRNGPAIEPPKVNRKALRSDLKILIGFLNFLVNIATGKSNDKEEESLIIVAKIPWTCEILNAFLARINPAACPSEASKAKNKPI